MPTISDQPTFEGNDRILLTVPERRRTMFLLKRLESMSYADIANACGVTPRIVEREVFLAMLQLR